MEQFEHLSDEPLTYTPTQEDVLRLFKLVFKSAHSEGGLPTHVVRSFLRAANRAPGELGEQIRRVPEEVDKGHLQESMQRNRPVDPRHALNLAFRGR